MFDCNDLIHPFQTDPGSSQSQRIMDELLSSSTKIDGRTLADLLNHFVQLSSHIKYYDADTLKETDWQPFFKNSIPFILASASKYKATVVNEKFQLYSKLFDKGLSVAGLQLTLYYFFYTTIYQVNNLYTELQATQLPIVPVLEALIKNKLQQPAASFIKLAYAAHQLFCIKLIDFTALYQKDSPWNLQPEALYDAEKDITNIGSKQQQLIAIQQGIKELFPSVLEGINVLKEAADSNIEQSLIPLKDELQKKHPPHLALIFTFLQIFRKLQDDLNGYSKKHLDFFYKDVLRLKPKGAVPDKVHLVFELQKQLKQYVLKKGLLVKADKDNNNAEIDFALNDEIGVNKTQVTDLRTLFVNNQSLHEKEYVEGVYMALKANTADGIDKELKDRLKNYPTLGAKYTKYIAPGQTTPQPYPYARLGFILASPVLLLNEGTRTITITINCKLDDGICTKLLQSTAPTADPCCNSGTTATTDNEKTLPNFFPADALLEQAKTAIQNSFIYVSNQLIDQASKQGLANELATDLRNAFLKDECKHSVCCRDKEFYKDAAVIGSGIWDGLVGTFTGAEQALLKTIFKPRTVFNVLFSGEKEWVEPQSPASISINATGTVSGFTITITTVLPPEQPAVTFYNKENLKEDYNTTLPLVKVEFNDAIKIALQDTSYTFDTGTCCLDKDVDLCGRQVSFYHFFRNVVITNTNINVTVCGLKNFIVQNDESVQDVNGPVYPFGVRPKIESNFYIGCEEVFLKKWSDISVNLNWKDIPPVSTLAAPLAGTRFRAYYNGYQDFFVNTGDESNYIEDDEFRMKIAVLQDGNWIPWKYDENCMGTSDPKSKLFQQRPAITFCDGDKAFEYQYQLSRTGDFSPILSFSNEAFVLKNKKKYDVNSRQSFLRITLKCQDFLHDRYPFVLARQMSALGKLPELIAGAVYFNIPPGGSYQVLDLNQVFRNVINSFRLSNETNPKIDNIQSEVLRGDIDNDAKVASISGTVNDDINLDFVPPPDPNQQHFDTLQDAETTLNSILNVNNTIVTNFGSSGVVIPKEPWTPIINGISLDYTANATNTDIDLIHLYPYPNTYKQEELTMQPSLLPVFCDEGTLFMGLTDLVPGENLNILFQFAEATSDSEVPPETVYWQYLANNQWKDLRTGFEIIEDATHNLTISGIIKFALPGNMTTNNTIMPAGLHWIKASVAKNSRSVSETIGVFTQAIQATFSNDEANDKNRLATPLKEGTLAKLQVADANVKQVNQPYPSFGGQVPEEEGHYYVRVSELLRHKGRAIQKLDYERLTLEAFPQIFKAKCINHTFALNANNYKNDFPCAPGYVLLAVIPNMNKLLAGVSFEPTVPAGIIEEIREYIMQRVSPFVRLRVMNPRYEKISFCLSVKLIVGKDPGYYKEKLKTDLQEFLAPWAVGQFDKLTFGQCVNKSDVIGFLENTDYVDYISRLEMFREADPVAGNVNEICPVTPRSILIAGDIDVCIEEGETPPNLDYQPCADITQVRDYCKPVIIGIA